jgi:hypothetical protein
MFAHSRDDFYRTHALDRFTQWLNTDLNRCEY